MSPCHRTRSKHLHETNEPRLLVGKRITILLFISEKTLVDYLFYDGVGRSQTQNIPVKLVTHQGNQQTNRLQVSPNINFQKEH